MTVDELHEVEKKKKTSFIDFTSIKFLCVGFNELLNYCPSIPNGNLNVLTRLTFKHSAFFPETSFLFYGEFSLHIFNLLVFLMDITSNSEVNIGHENTNMVVWIYDGI